MKISLINDWRYLFCKDAIGGRFGGFAFFMLSWLKTGISDPDIDGLTFVVMGIGIRIRANTSPRKQQV